jgi:hypothetical protein
MSTSRIAASLSRWATAEHRRAAEHDVVFHSKDIPDTIGRARAGARAFIADIKGRLGPPKSHVNHRYWVMGIEAWKGYREFPDAPVLIKELAPYKVGLSVLLLRARRTLKRRLKAFAAAMRRVLEESPLSRTIFNPGWADYRLLRGAMEGIVAAAGPREVLVVGAQDGLIRSVLPSTTEVSIAHPRNLQTVLLNPNRDKRYRTILLYVGHKITPGILKHLFDQCVSAGTTDATICIFVRKGWSGSSYKDVSRLLFGLGDVFQNRVQSWRLQSAGGFVSDLSRRILLKAAVALRRSYSRHGAVSVLWTVPPFIAAYLLAVAGNATLWIQRVKSGSERHHGSLLIYAKLWEKLQSAEARSRIDARTELRASELHQA